MAYDFPASPSVGTLFAPAGGPTWQWNGTAWTNVSPANLVPEAPQDGQNYVRRNGVWVPAPGTAEARSRIVNGAMQISQENGNANAPIGYAADQWTTYSSYGGVHSYQRVASVTPNGSQYRLRLAITTADASVAAGDLVQMYTRLEGVRIADFGWGTAAARQVVLRFGFRGPAGSYGVALQQPAGTHSWASNIVISAGQANTDTVQTFVIPGPTVGTWATDTAAGLDLVICPMAGSTSVAPSANAWLAGGYKSGPGNTNGAATVGNTFELFDVGLYLDPQSTGIAPPWQMPDEAQELAACQRYWHRDNIDFNTSANTTNMAITMRFGFPTSMRTSPGITEVNIATGNTVFQAFDTLTPNGFRIWVNAPAAGGLYRSSNYIANARM